jgi:hypothetical protein
MNVNTSASIRGLNDSSAVILIFPLVGPSFIPDLTPPIHDTRISINPVKRYRMFDKKL